MLGGIYVGSITANLGTDCKDGVQMLDGYESAFGYSAFFKEGINAAEKTK